MIEANEYIEANYSKLEGQTRGLVIDAFVAGHQSKQAKIDELQKKLDCCREENKSLLERLAVYDKHVKAIKHIHETQFDKNTDTSFILGNLDGFIECLESDLKGNKDD